MVPVIDDNKQLTGVFTREVLYKELLKNISLETQIKPYVTKFESTTVYETKYDDIKKDLIDNSVCSFFVVDDEKQLVGIIKMKGLMSYITKINCSSIQLEQAVYLNYRGAFKINKEEIIVIVNASIFDFPEKNDSKKNMSFLSATQPQLSTSLNFIHRNDEGQERIILQLEPKSTAPKEHHLLQNDFTLEKIKETKLIKGLQKTVDIVHEQLQDGIIIVNELGEIISFNHKITDLFQLENEEILGFPVQDVLPMLKLERVIETEVAEPSIAINCNGVLCIVQNIPVVENGQVLGAISRVIYNGINKARENMMNYDFSNKMHEIRESINRFEALINIKRKNEQLKNESLITFNQIITENTGMKKTVRHALKAANGRSTILIRGESGTGKELFAQASHYASARKDYPFVSVNCAAIPEHLLESEFFGYETGAFTGAEKGGKIGKFDLANGGTLFLDEIGDMAPALQAKLLRVLQDSGFYRVGGIKKIHVDVRIIAATHRNLEEMIKNGEFREDLYYRLNVITIDIAPLRERKEDILVHTKRYLRELNEFLGTNIVGVTPVVKEILTNYRWPGNIRELRNVIESAMTMTDNQIIQKEDLPYYIQKNSPYEIEIHHGMTEKTIQLNTSLPEQENKMLEDALQLTEQEMIKQALIKTHGNKTKAAKMLGISRSVLYEKLAKYQLISSIK
ncbi:sigma 54-interacting transcriptional regulator [Psychrobacillus sp. BM2]|uniref:sigma 54-interacting transcriptional regulator n=1 Tax=Psychrobacillus sp. BM2 TaxID=3400421 RepID=UPI003B019BF0